VLNVEFLCVEYSGWRREWGVPDQNHQKRFREARKIYRDVQAVSVVAHEVEKNMIMGAFNS
jgi:hypothetical protein